MVFCYLSPDFRLHKKTGLVFISACGRGFRITQGIVLWRSLNHVKYYNTYTHTSSCHDSVTPYFRNKKTSGGTRISHSLVETLLARKWLLNFLVPGNRPTNHSKRTLAPNSSFFYYGVIHKSISTLTLLRLRSSTKQVNLLFPFGTNVLACFHSRLADISFHRLLDVVILLQFTVMLSTSPMSPLCCLRR